MVNKTFLETVKESFFTNPYYFVRFGNFTFNMLTKSQFRV